MANTLYPQLQSFQLYSSGVTVGDTSIVITSMKDIDGVQLSMANFGDKGFITIDAGAGILEEQLSFSGLTANANGTTTLSGVKTVLCLSPYTETSGAAKAHSGGSTVVVSVSSGLLNQLANKGNTETITGAWTFTSTAIASYDSHPTFVTDTQIIDKKYADDLAIAGSPDASTTVKGIIEIATGAELAAGTGTGGTGAVIVPAGSSFKNSSAGAGDANKVPVLGADGLLDQTFLDKARTWGAEQSFTANNCQITSDADSANDAVRYSYAQAMTSQNAGTGTSGEAYSVGNALYVKASDGRLYKTQGTADESTYSFVGIALDAAAGAGTTGLRFAKPGGIATGLSGLTAGSYYFISDTAGVIAVTPGTRFAKIGQALTTTTLRVCEPTFIRTGSFTGPNNTSLVVTTGFYPAKISLAAQATGGSGINSGSTSPYGTGGNTYNNSGDGGYLESYVGSQSVVIAAAGGGGSYTGSITAKTQTSFTLTSTSAFFANCTVYWCAESL